MEKIFLPFIAARLVVVGKGTVFYTNNSELVVEAPDKLMSKLVKMCNGRRSISHIVELLKNDWDEKSLRGLIDDLCDKNILINAADVVEKIWDFIENPIGFPAFLSEKDRNYLVNKAKRRQRGSVYNQEYESSLTPFRKLLKNRRSVRLFSGKVLFQNIVDMLWSAYGEIKDGHRTVPSAGALYPLKIHLVVLEQNKKLVPAIYRVYFRFPRLGFNLVSKDIDSFLRSFFDPMMLEGAFGVITISGSLNVMAEKYGSRSLLFTVLEAGHVAQNINIAAAEKNIATVEIGGFQENLLKRAIHLSRRSHPFIVIAFGREDKTIRTGAIDKKIEVQWQLPTNKQYYPPFAIASARVLKKQSWSNGRDSKPRLAYAKAVAEAKEWAACGCIPGNLIREKFINLKTAINPETIIKFHSLQYRQKKFPFRPFDERMEYKWTEGINELTGLKVYVLADHVYFPYFPETPYYCYANSSGVAAYPYWEKAVETSTLELIERDSFMIAYLARIQFPTIQEKGLTESIQKRIKELRKVGFKVWVKDHSLDLAPSICVIAQSEEYAYTPCASCANFNVEHAIDHALMEVEALILSRFQNGPAESIKPEEVIWPLDHGKLYGQRRYFHRANFLFYGHNKISFNEIGRNAVWSWPNLLSRFETKGWQLITIPLHLSSKYGGNDDLHIVRSIVPGMVPMTFGFRQEPAGVERLYKIAKDFGNIKLSYGGLTKFPHPFA